MIVALDGRYAEDNLTGIGNYIKHLVKGLSRMGLKCIILYSKEPRLRVSAPNVSSVILSPANRHILEQVLVPRLLVKEKVDLYHATGNFGVPLFCPTPAVLTVHDIIPLTVRNYFLNARFPLLSRGSYIFQISTSCWRANKIITISEFVRGELKERLGVGKEKISVINSGVQPKKAKKALSFGLKKHQFILNHGGIEDRKNLGGLIKAFGEVKVKLPSLKLVITGDNEQLKPKLQEEAKKMGLGKEVIFTGYVDERILWSLISNAICVCYPSLAEGYGTPILEAFSIGTPVVASNTTSIPEIAEGAAILVDPKDSQQITEGIVRVIRDKKLRSCLIKKGISRSKKYKWSSTVEKTVEVYKEAIR